MLSDGDFVGDDVVNCLCKHMNQVESYVHAYMTDVHAYMKSYIRCFCCIEGDDLEVIWYRIHLEESRTLHAFEQLMSHVIIEYVTW